MILIVKPVNDEYPANENCGGDIKINHKLGEFYHCKEGARSVLTKQSYFYENRYCYIRFVFANSRYEREMRSPYSTSAAQREGSKSPEAWSRGQSFQLQFVLGRHP